jgi:alkylation response protein AidB-like acyl-CoA dehydrogenase
MVLGDLAAEIEVSGAYADACLAAHAAGGVDPRRAAVAKLRCTELLGRAVDAGVQLHGGYGYMVEYPISRAYEDARILRLLGGSSEALRRELAAAWASASPRP